MMIKSIRYCPHLKRKATETNLQMKPSQITFLFHNSVQQVCLLIFKERKTEKHHNTTTNKTYVKQQSQYMYIYAELTGKQNIFCKYFF